MICVECKKESGNVGVGVVLVRNGSVPGHQGYRDPPMRKNDAYCYGCLRDINTAKNYRKATDG